MTTELASNGTAELAPPRPIVELIPVALIDPSPSNPRKHFDDAHIKDIAESLKTHGQLENILVRPSPTKSKRFELVFGECRLRAAKLAKVTDLLASVKELTDVQVLETQLIENARRRDLHPLEEAETYEALHTKHGYSVDDIAVKVNKSRASVYASMKLLALAPDVRKLFFEGKLTPSTALLVARIPVAELQKEAVKTIIGTYNEPMTAREAGQHIRDKYMLRLADAPFDKGDAGLVPKAGACTTCPKRTGNQRELFGDVKSADTCTDPVCFGLKKDAAWSKRKVEAEEAGQAVLDEKQSKKLFPYSDYIAHDSDFIDLKDRCGKDPKGRTWDKLLGKSAPATTIARDGTGKVHELVPRTEASAALKKAGHKWAKPEPVATKAKKPKKQAGAAELVEKLERQRLFEAAAKKSLTDGTVYRLVIEYVLSSVGGFGADVVAEHRGLCPKAKKHVKYEAASRAIRALAAKARPIELRQLVAELMAAESEDGMFEFRGAVMKAFGVERKSIEAEAKKQLETAKKPAAAKPAKKKGGAK